MLALKIFETPSILLRCRFHGPVKESFSWNFFQYANVRWKQPIHDRRSDNHGFIYNRYKSPEIKNLELFQFIVIKLRLIKAFEKQGPVDTLFDDYVAFH